MKKSSSILFTVARLKQLPCTPLNKELIAELEKWSNSTTLKKGKSKYRNKKTEVDGIIFDSIKEANRYKELSLLLKAGEIGMLERQVKFKLTDNISYVADFVFIEIHSGNKIIEDVKSSYTKKLPVYRMKKKLMKSILGIDIQEV